MKEQKIEISLLTNINNDDTEKVAILINVIENLLKEQCTYSIELRHNSPWDFFIPIFADPNNISLIINSITVVFSAIQTKVALNQAKKVNKVIPLDTILSCRNRLSENNITVKNLTININGNVQIYNKTIQK